jgi:hypothetical protein
MDRRSRMRRRTGAGRVVSAAGVLAGLWLSGAVFAQAPIAPAEGAAPARPGEAPVQAPSPEAAALLRELVAQLDSTDFNVRREAQSKLLADQRFTLPMIEEIFAGGRLSPEQRARLLAVGKDRFLGSPRAAMGVQFGDSPALRYRVIVGRTFARFPSHRLLEEGDIIVEADGQPLRGRDARWRLQGMIVSRDPGQTLPIVVRRGAEKIKIDLALGRFDDLENGGFLDDGRLQNGWLVRSFRYTPADERAARTIAPALPGKGPWPAEFSRRAQIDRQQARMRVGEVAAPTAVGAGMPRGAAAVDPDDARQVAVVINNRRRLAMLRQQQFLFNQALDLGDPSEVPTPFEELSLLDKTIAELREIVASGPVQGPKQPGGVQRPDLDLGLELGERGERAIQILEKQRAAVQAEIDEQGLKQSPAEEGAATVPDGNVDKDDR